MWLKREKDDESVSLTMMVVTFVILVVAVILELAKVVQSIGSTFEIFGATAALYFGRRLSFKGKVFDGSKKDESAKNA